MTLISRAVSRGCLVLSLGIVSSCGTEAPYSCPEVAVIEDAAKLVKFRDGPGRDPTDVVYEAKITRARLDCSFEDTTVDTKVAFQLVARKGPAASSDTITLPYFAAVVSNDERKLVSKRQFEVVVPFHGQGTVTLAQQVPEDATIVPKPADLTPGRSSRGGGSSPDSTHYDIKGPSLYAGDSDSKKKQARKPGIILPGVQGAVPYQVLLGFQLDKEQLAYNRTQPH
ncbi:MAG: hypothetical protein JO124_06790 [Hyphomicrobiales bacterium]|nr:hypothetical protein [Hyphomicrobiales bacterium]